MIIAIIVITILLIPIAFRWVIGIEYMNKNYPDYKGEELFGEDDNKTKDKPLKQ